MVTRELGLRRGTICTDGSWNGELSEEAFQAQFPNHGADAGLMTILISLQ